MKLKKLLAVILSAIIIFAVVPIGAFTVSALYSGYFTYTVSNNQAKITHYDEPYNGRPIIGNLVYSNVIIPSTLGGYPVTAIDDSAFSFCEFSSIVIPDSVTSIGEGAFAYCYMLDSVKIPDGVTSIQAGTFYGCISLCAITIPDSVTSIGDNAFYDCSSLGTVRINDFDAWCNISFGNEYSNPMYNGGYLYVNNQLFVDLTLPDSSIIDTTHFNNCKSIENIFVPKSVLLVRKNVFSGCSGIKNIYYEGTAEEWAEVTVLSGNDYFINANVYYNSTGIISSIEITKLPDKLKYIENDETLDLTGGILTLNYKNGTSKVIDLTDIDVEGFDNTVLGKQTVTVKYDKYSDTFDVEIIPRPMTFVAVSAFPTKTMYTLGESLDLTGGKLAVGYPEGGYEIFDLTADMVTGYDSDKSGIQILTVTYKGYTTKFAIEVFKKAVPDLDSDGSINANDVIILRKELFNNNAYNEEYDINGNGSIDIRDIINLKKQIAYII